ncbi:MAG: hypothetical protein II851_00165 [Bacteroidales bacterium]|nr:hypothetical protein [Bacteroidales bacterium]
MRRLPIILAAWLLPLAAFSQGIIPAGETFLEALLPRDSVLVADPFDYGFILKNAPKGATYELPDLSKGLVEGVAASSWRVDSLLTLKQRRALYKGEDIPVDIRISTRIVPFEEGEIQLPPLSVRRSLDGIVDTLVFDPQILDVRPMPIDTATFQIHDIKGQIRYPLTLSEILPWIMGFDLLAVLVIGLVCLILSRRRKNEASHYKEPAYIVALRGLDRYRGDKYWAPEKQKTMYSGITDTLRTYIESRFDVNAEEMTTAEIFDSLKSEEDLTPELYAEVKELFELSDFVKFAKHTASDEENARAIPTAVRFVTSTYQTQLDAEAAQTEKEEEG